MSPPPAPGFGLSLEHHVFASNSDSSQNANIPGVRLRLLSQNEPSISFNSDWLEGEGGGGMWAWGPCLPTRGGGEGEEGIPGHPSVSLWCLGRQTSTRRGTFPAR